MPFDVQISDLTNYAGQNADTAKTAIEALGFTVEKTWERSDTVSSGNVIRQTTREIPFEHIVLLVVSIGGYSAADRAALMSFGMAFAASSGEQARPNTVESIGL